MKSIQADPAWPNQPDLSHNGKIHGNARESDLKYMWMINRGVMPETDPRRE
jgi:hypothetical protein